ncbi:sodium-independent sulfate anion transporter isoform X9 [Mirounga angustirostris]|uniref:sodium-independent sulfate anion transporter isoform X9 n=1 Tax=Mirounga angustirostris TaxID=9716 RepID=UPI00313E46C9
MPSSVKALGQARPPGASMAPQAHCCSPAAVQRRLPILAWLPDYSLQWLKMDFIAGLSVGLTVIPQALAYAEVAGLPPQYGLYSAFTGCFVYFFLGTSRDVTLGPTAIMSLLVSFYTFHEPAYAVLLAFLSGCIQLAMGFLRLGFLLDFISCPIIKGFTSAATITIGFGQIKNLLGLQDIPRQFLLQVYQTFRKVGETSPQRPGRLLCRPGRILLRGDRIPAFRSNGEDHRGAPSSPDSALLSDHGQWDSFLHRDGTGHGCWAGRGAPGGSPGEHRGGQVLRPDQRAGLPRLFLPGHRQLWTDGCERPVGGVHPSGGPGDRSSGAAVAGLPDLAVLLHPQVGAGCRHHHGGGSAVRHQDLPDALAREEAGLAAPLPDVPALLLGGPVWHPGRDPGVCADSPALRGQTQDAGVRRAGAGPAASQRSALPRGGGPPGGLPHPGPGRYVSQDEVGCSHPQLLPLTPHPSLLPQDPKALSSALGSSPTPGSRTLGISEWCLSTCSTGGCSQSPFLNTHPFLWGVGI